jgi:LPS O-antigen subunit length determinant protein (WzzB/FepE family)
VEWRDPELAAQWANDLVASVNTTLRQKTVEQSEKSIAYLREQLARTSVVELQQVLHRLVESEMKKAILANINKEYAFKIIDPAVVPDKPVRPRKLAMVVVGTAAGGILGILLVLLRNAWSLSQAAGDPERVGSAT